MMHPRGVKHLQFPKKYILFESEQIDSFRIIKWFQILSPSDNNEFLFDLDSLRCKRFCAVSEQRPREKWRE